MPDILRFTDERDGNSFEAPIEDEAIRATALKRRASSATTRRS